MRITALLLTVLLAGCAIVPQPGQLPAQLPERLPERLPGRLPSTPASAGMQWYQDAAAAGKTVWPIDTKASLIAVTVRRGGAMARLGHDHVVASRSIDGMVAPDDGRADFRFRLDQLRVDDGDLRQEAGLTTAPSEAAIEGTRTNMLTKVLDADRYPVVELSVTPAAESSDGLEVSNRFSILDGSDGSTVLRLRVRLNGAERSVDVPTRIERRAEGLTATGSFTMLQTDFGITPMSVLGGAITVLDQMELRFHLVAGKP